MPREIKTEEEIRQIVQDRIEQSNELEGDCRHVIAGHVNWHEPDETGSNWDINYFRNATGCEHVLNLIINEIKDLYNLEDR